MASRPAAPSFGLRRGLRLRPCPLSVYLALQGFPVPASLGTSGSTLRWHFAPCRHFGFQGFPGKRFLAFWASRLPFGPVCLRSRFGGFLPGAAPRAPGPVGFGGLLARSTRSSGRLREHVRAQACFHQHAGQIFPDIFPVLVVLFETFSHLAHIASGPAPENRASGMQRPGKSWRTTSADKKQGTRSRA